MKVRALHFGMLREARGVTEETLELPGPTTMRALYDTLFDEALQALPVAFACNEVYVDAAHVVVDGDEVVFVPPVGGG